MAEAVRSGRANGSGVIERPYIPANQILFTPAEVAEILSVSKATICRWADEGQIRAGRLVGRIKIHRSEVQRLLDELYEGMETPE